MPEYLDQICRFVVKTDFKDLEPAVPLRRAAINGSVFFFRPITVEVAFPEKETNLLVISLGSCCCDPTATAPTVS